MVTITIDGGEIEVPKGASLLHVCLDNGAAVPYFCDHRKLDPIGACRMCVVQIEGQPKLATACTITTTEGMRVWTESPDVINAREGVLEFLLINHPLDCPVCDKGGECDLQDFSFYHGAGKSRFFEEKVKYPKPVPLSEKILLDMERCVLCERCVRYFDEVTEEGQLVLLNRGVHTMIGTFNGEAMDSPFQGNIMELCPVGALTSADWRFSARPWDMRSTPSVCHGCAVGCNTQVQTRDDRVVRYMSRDNPAVDDGWLCDRGRYGFHFVNDDRRILEPRLGRGGEARPVAYAEAVAAVAQRLQEAVQSGGPDKVGAIASPQATNEELFLFQRWVREVIGSPNLDHRVAATEAAPSPDDFRLAIEDLATCQVIYILGDQPTLDAAPILELRLKKARRAAQTRLVLAHGRGAPELHHEAPEGATRAGVIAPQSLATEAVALGAYLIEHGLEVRRLTVLPAANSRGAADVGCLPAHAAGYQRADGTSGMNTLEMLQAAADGRLKALVLMGPSPLDEQLPEGLVDKAIAAVELLIVLDVLEGPLSRTADIVLPLHTFAEKDGTYTNLEGRIQRLRQAIPPVAPTPPDWRLLTDLANAWEAGWTYRQPRDVMADIIAAVPAYAIEKAGGRARWWDS
jgi:NADH-quinone oxidoreductase subunit G